MTFHGTDLIASSAARLRRLAGLLLVGGAAGLVAAPAAADQWTLTSGIHLDAWSANGSSGQGNGYELLIPVGIFYDTPNWGLGARGSVGTSQHDLDAAPSASMSGFTDTTVSGYYRLRPGGADIRFGLDMDLPTGVSSLKTRDLPAVQDEDLVALQRFGEGFDVNPTVIVYKNFGDWGIGGGIGYLWTGEYDPTEDIPERRFQPRRRADGQRARGRLPGRRVAPRRPRGIHSLQRGRAGRGRGVPGGWRAGHGRQPGVAPGALVGHRVGARHLPLQGGAPQRGRPARRGAPEQQRERDPRSRDGRLHHRRRLDGAGHARRAVRDGERLRDVSDPLYDGGRFKIAVGPGITWTSAGRSRLDASVRWFYLDAERSPTFPSGAKINGVHADMRVTYRF